MDKLPHNDEIVRFIRGRTGGPITIAGIADHFGVPNPRRLNIKIGQLTSAGYLERVGLDALGYIRSPDAKRKPKQYGYRLGRRAKKKAEKAGA